MKKHKRKIPYNPRKAYNNEVPFHCVGCLRVLNKVAPAGTIEGDAPGNPEYHVCGECGFLNVVERGNNNNIRPATDEELQEVKKMITDQAYKIWIEANN